MYILSDVESENTYDTSPVLSATIDDTTWYMACDAPQNDSKQRSVIFVSCVSLHSLIFPPSEVALEGGWGTGCVLCFSWVGSWCVYLCEEANLCASA